MAFQTLEKPEPRRRVKAREQRQAAKVVKSVRAQCVDRDGYCRIYQHRWIQGFGSTPRLGACEGASEWAHLGEKKRFKTRGQAPEIRHTTAGSLMLCAKHHDDYDEGRLRIVGDDANQPLRFEAVR
jgi:hypothetical protein